MRATGDADGAMRQEVVYTFGPFRLFPGRQLLVNDGAAVKLGGRAFELLHILVQRSGELVGKDELMAAAWPGVFVHESNLKVNMHSLRRSLGDTQKQPAYIATVPGRGYRFVAAVREGVGEAFEGRASPPAGAASRLPAPREIVGRDREIDEIVRRLEASSLVTVVGAAGIGKTTAAVAAARGVEARYADGVCFVDLAMIDDPTFLPGALAAALGLRGDRGEALAAVVDHLGQRSMLVLLDNCEHVLPAVAIFARQLGLRPGPSRLLATSRAPLGLASESVVRLEALAVPPEGATAGRDEILASPAVELFLQRASEWSGYQLVDEDVAAVGRICRALDGLPLAIELAAGKLEAQGPRGLLAQLDGHLGFRNDRAAAPTARHETLLAAIDWSFGLLSGNETSVFCLVSVFAGTFGLEDAVEIAAGSGIAPLDVVAALGGLVSKSLLTAQVEGAGLRYRLLDSTRRYAARRRHEAGLDPRARRAHAERVIAVFEQSETEWAWRDSDDWIQNYLARLADVQAALAWAFGDGGDVALGVRLTVAALPLWFETSLISETRTRVETALANAERCGCDALLRAKLAHSLAWSMMYGRRLVPEIEGAWAETLRLARRAGSLDYELKALVGLAVYLMDVGRLGEATARLEAFRALCAYHRDWSLAPEGERTLAWITAHTGDLGQSLATLDGLAIAHSRVGKGSRMAGFQVDRYIGIRNYASFFSWVAGRPDKAAALARDAIEVSEALGHLASQSNVLALAGCPVSHQRGDAGMLAAYVDKLGAILAMQTIGIWLPVHRFFAAVLAEMRGAPTAIAEMQRAIDELVDSRFVMRVGGCIGVLAESLVRAGRLDEAGDAIAEAMRFAAGQDERWCRAELMRIDAAMLARSGRGDRAEGLLLDALDEAHAIGALAYELRIASDLAAHYLGTGRDARAVAVLAPVHGRFDEGFATRDLTAAARLLARAGGARGPAGRPAQD